MTPAAQLVALEVGKERCPVQLGRDLFPRFLEVAIGCKEWLLLQDFRDESLVLRRGFVTRHAPNIPTLALLL